MAHLEVTPKKRSLAWLWILLALIALIVIYLLYKKSPDRTQQVVVDSTSTTVQRKDVVAVTEPDWNNVDLNSGTDYSDPDISDKDIRLSKNDDYTVYSLGENVLFATGDNTLQGSAEAKLRQVVSSLGKNFKGAYIGVYGNTDTVGSASANKELGSERATAVKDWLINEGGIDAGKISTHSLGEKEPVASNATASGRQQNRNVKIVAFRNKQ